MAIITYEGNSLNERLDAAPSSFAARVLSKRSIPYASHTLLTQAAYARHR